MKKKLKLFESFDPELDHPIREEEEDGYGDKDFHLIKDGDVFNFFFKLTGDEGSRGFVLSIGKFSKYSTPTDAKNAYGAITLTELPIEDLDQAILDEGTFEDNENEIQMNPTFFTRFTETFLKIIEGYLRENSKVIKFYDENQDTLKVDDYVNKISMKFKTWQSGIWSIQDIEKGRDALITK